MVSSFHQLSTGAGAPPPARPDADTSPRIRMSSARYGRRRFSTGAGAPPPARPDADTSPRIRMSSARDGRRRSFTGAGAPPPARPDADPSPRIRMSSARDGRRRFFTEFLSAESWQRETHDSRLPTQLTEISQDPTRSSATAY